MAFCSVASSPFFSLLRTRMVSWWILMACIARAMLAAAIDRGSAVHAERPKLLLQLAGRCWLLIVTPETIGQAGGLQAQAVQAGCLQAPHALLPGHDMT